MVYINSKGSDGIETIDQFNSLKEAKEMIKEYRLAFGSNYFLYLSQRSTKEWREQNK